MAEKKERRWVFVLLFIAIIAIVLLFTQSIGLTALDFSSHGHGNIHSGMFSSLGKSLGILEDYDYVDEETGEAYCFNSECWDDADDEYDACLAEYAEFSQDVSIDISFLEMVPAVSAIARGEMGTACDEAYLDMLIDECSQRCEEEVYEWDMTPVTDLGLFAETAFPDFTSNAEFSCESWFSGGTWISRPDKVGCEDGAWIFCGSNSIASAGEVCETIGKVWTCSFNEATCSES